MERGLREKALFGVRACPQCGEDKDTLYYIKTEDDITKGIGYLSLFKDGRVIRLGCCETCGCQWEEENGNYFID